MSNRTLCGYTIKDLRKMAKLGLIELHADTGKKVSHWTGAETTAFYIEKALVRTPFEYKGRKYDVRYFSGCFDPFVWPVDVPAPSFV